MSDPGKTFRAPRGMPDLSGPALERLAGFQTLALKVLALHGFREIRTPLLEETRLFARATGATSDIVEKQMFTVPVAEGESYSLRPEGTPGVVRAYLEGSLGKQRPFVKLSYAGPMFRYERPQAARQRQFHQVGAESFGSGEPLVDVDSILAATAVLRASGLRAFTTRVNTIGCATCRPALREAVRKIALAAGTSLCEACRRRMDANPLRFLDCREPGCREAARSVPPPEDLVCADCRAHFGAVKAGLSAMEEPFTVDPRLVRGLDYYTRTVFELTVPELGARDAVGGGGRYDDLVAELGGPPTPCVGFALGVEATLLALDKTGAGPAAGARPEAEVFVAVPVGEGRLAALRLAGRLRALGVSADLDLEGRSLKAQMRAADRSGARVVLLYGPDEEARGVVRWKPFRSAPGAAGAGAEEDIPLAEALRRLSAPPGDAQAR
jgi:histidyl-tRNA synthetase